MWDDLLEIDSLISKKHTKGNMPISLGIVVIVVSDTRNGSTDKSGKVLEERILKSGHKLFEKCFIKDDIKAIKKIKITYKT